MLYAPPAPASVVRALTFRTAVMVMTPDVTVSVFPDGKVNTMHLRALDTPEYRQIAAWAGYGDHWRRYNREHDATHHWLADRMGWRWSPALHDPEPVAIGEASDEMKREEHMVNRLQRMSQTGEPDEYGVLQQVFGDRLSAAVADLSVALGRVP